jgi:hypothetical protein
MPKSLAERIEEITSTLANGRPVSVPEHDDIIASVRELERNDARWRALGEILDAPGAPMTYVEIGVDGSRVASVFWYSDTLAAHVDAILTKCAATKEATT